MIPDTVLERDQSALADGLVEGWFLHQRRGHVGLPVRIWWGAPPDLEFGGELDRSPRWNIEVAGELLGHEFAARAMASFEDIWPRARDKPITQSEALYRLARIAHARQHDPNDPYGHHRGRIDLFTATVPF
jgi:hypothetical protein